MSTNDLNAKHPDSNIRPELGRNEIIEEVAAEMEKSPITYAGPNPEAIHALHRLFVQAIRDMKVQK